jgi:hypothetical protein
MPQSILVKGNSQIGATIALAAIGAIAVVITVVVAVAEKPIAASLLGIVGLALCSAAGLKQFFDCMGRVYVELDHEGFRVRDRQGELDYRDRQVSALASEIQPVYLHGNISAGRRIATLRIGDEPGELLRMDYIFPLGTGTDPLGAFFGRLEGMLLSRLRDEIAAGREATGECWSLDAKTLIVDSAEVPGRYPIAGLADVGVVDRKVTVWERGAVEPILEMPLSTLNAWALVPLLHERLPPGSRADSDGLGDGLGRIIFRRDQSSSFAAIVVALILGFGLALVGIGLTTFAILARQGVILIFFVGLVMFLVGGIVMLRSVFRRVDVLQVHSLGVTRATTLGTKEIRHEEVGTFTWSGVRQFVHGTYTGTTIRLELRPVPGVVAPVVRYSTRVKGSDEELERLRDFIASMIAGRWLRLLQDGQPVRWTVRSTFLPEGLHHKKGSFGGTPEVFPYGNVFRWETRDGWLYLYGLASKPLVQEAITQANFFPGFSLLMYLVGQGGIPPRPTEPGRARVGPLPAISSPGDDRIQRPTGIRPDWGIGQDRFRP